MTRHQTTKLNRLLTVFALVLSALSSGVSAETATSLSNAIENVDVSSQPGGKVVVKVTLSQQPSQPPAAFTTNNPPRITLDFLNASNALPKKSISTGNALVQNISSAQANNRTRMVLNLSAASTFSTSVDGRNVLITLSGNSASGTSDNAVTHFSQPASATSGGQQNNVTNVDFQRGKNGEGRIIVDLQEAGTGIDIRQQGKNLVVDFINSALDDKLQRRLNVNNFATPVSMVDTFKQGQNVRMTIEPKGDWEHSAYQMDKRFIVEVKPITFDSSKAVQGSKAGFSGEKLSLDFNGIDVKSLLRIIGDFTGKNIVVSDGVQGTITLRLKDVPWDQALDIIMKQKGLGMENLGNTLVFAPKAEIATRQKENQDQENLLDDVKPLITQSFSIKYQKAADIKTLISDPKQPLLSKRGSAMVDVVTNTLFVKDIDTSQAKIQDILNKIDIPARQVLIEARIVNADESFSKSLGAKFGVVSSQSLGSTAPKNPGGADTITTSGNLTNNYGIIRDKNTLTPNDLNVNLPANNVYKGTNAALSALAFTLFRLPAGFLLNLELSASEADGKTKVISSPRVITANQTQATFDAGEEIPYLQQSSSGAANVAFKKATLGLNVTPQITPDDKIAMDIEVTNDTRGDPAGTAGFAINTNKVKTKVIVDNGETAVLGGFYKETKQDSNDRVPFFSSLPIVGPLFRSTVRADKKQEILFFITPKVMSDTMQLN